MNNDLLILGAGQYGMVAREIARDMGCFKKIDFLDDNNEIAIGKLDDYEQFSSAYSYAVVAIGNPELRLSLIQKLEESCYTIAILVSPKAHVSPSAQLMKGTIVEPMAVVNTGAVVATGCIISAGTVVNHNAFVGDVCHCGCNSVIRSGALVPAGTKVHCGEVIQPEATVMTFAHCPDDYSFDVGM